ncbi:MAG: radical SAM protein [Flavobacterium sp.]|nr:MAG: radical SAM protein [Flavobacterium sp.]
MTTPVLLITPPFTQLNTPYPATAYLKGFLNTQQITSVQADLGIEVILKIFSKSGLERLFSQIDSGNFSDNAMRILSLKETYIATVDSVISFLQGHNPTLALRICQEDFLPEASRFGQLEELEWAFGSMGLQDKAKHLATLYLEDLSDLIVECVDPNFGFSRYAERLGRSAYSFDALYEELNKELSFVDRVLVELLEERTRTGLPALVLISVPFPGNLFAAFRTAQWFKTNHAQVKIAMGGGFPNTELRSLSDVRVFDFFDFITLDDGERPVRNLIDFISGQFGTEVLKRTFMKVNGVVSYFDNADLDYRQSQVGTPDYSDLLLDRYISVIEVVNPMHRMWSDGRWNKLTMAHGCYWGKCTFCDISLDYIKVYEPIAAGILCDRMQELIDATGQNGFHFVDEAAPPALMRSLALEILRRRMIVTWWTNIRFEKNFTKDLCVLLKASGCIAVSGGLEVASDRLLKLIDKGVTVAQVAAVTRNFTEAGIMVHSYLMYGYPTQTMQETVDSLEMVRQMFELGILQSGFWHQFAMTAHSPVGMYPERFGVNRVAEPAGGFALNDVEFNDPTGVDHEMFSFGLQKSLYNYMHGICFDYKLQDWFDFKIPRTTVRPNYIQEVLTENDSLEIRLNAKIVWIGGIPIVSQFVKSKKGRNWNVTSLKFHGLSDVTEIVMDAAEGLWLLEFLQKISVHNQRLLTVRDFKTEFETAFADFELFWHSRPMKQLRELGLLVF